MLQVTEGRARRDPAPSRLAFRLQRLWLTPVFRRLLRVGLPTFLALFLIVWGISDHDRQNAIREQVAVIQQSIAERPEFMVKLLAIDGAGAELSTNIREILALDFPTSSFDLDLDRIKSAVEELDAVAVADLQISPSDILHLKVTERIPVVVWRTRGSVEALDAEGNRVAVLASRMERTDLPLIVGEGADRAVPEALALFASAGPLESRLRGLVRLGERRWNVVLDRSQRILLPEWHPVHALEQVIALNQAKGLLARDLVTIDMRKSHRPTLRMTPQARAEFRRIIVLESGGANQ